MLKKFLDYQRSLTEKGKPLHRLKPLITAADTFFYQSPDVAKKGPHIRDAVDVKRWMILVVLALFPCILSGIWNCGMQAFVYSSGDYHLMDEFLMSTGSFRSYLAFIQKDQRWISILREGCSIVFPIILVSYIVGGLWETLFAIVRGHEISEGFFVTGMLFALVMPPTIPLWMVAVGVSIGIIFAKEVFGGSGHNIVNPALACRAFLFFAYPGRMSGNVWVGSDLTKVQTSLIKMNQDAGKSTLDGYTQATKLSQFNVPLEVKKIHIDALASNHLGKEVRSYETLTHYLEKWKQVSGDQANFGLLSEPQMYDFVTAPLSEGGLALSPGYYEGAYHFANLNYGLEGNSDLGFFFGNKLGCIGETSTFACILGAIFLLYTGIASWRTMLGMALGAFLMAISLQYFSNWVGIENGAWNPAQLGFPAYKHFLLGGLAFGLVFMATDPVSSPDVPLAKYIYGAFCGMVAIVVRVINPAFPEGVMLAILMGNVFAPLFDHYAVKFWRKRRLRRVQSGTG